MAKSENQIEFESLGAEVVQRRLSAGINRVRRGFGSATKKAYWPETACSANNSRHRGSGRSDHCNHNACPFFHSPSLTQSWRCKPSRSAAHADCPNALSDIAAKRKNSALTISGDLPAGATDTLPDTAK